MNVICCVERVMVKDLGFSFFQVEIVEFSVKMD